MIKSSMYTFIKYNSMHKYNNVQCIASRTII